MTNIFDILNETQRTERINKLVTKIAVIMFVLMQIPIFLAITVGKELNVAFALIIEIVAISSFLLIYFKRISLALFISIVFLYSIFAAIPHVFDSYHMTIPVIMATFIFNTYIFEQKIFKRLNIIALTFTLIAYYSALHAHYEIFFEFIVDSATGIISFIVIYIVIQYFKSDIQQYQQQLKTVNSFLTQITDLNPHFIYAKNSDQQFIFINKTMAEFYGHPPNEIIGKQVERFYENSENIDHKYKNTTNDNRSYRLVTVTDKENAPTYLELIKTLIFNEQGEIIGTLGVAIDITAKRKIKVALSESEQRYRHLYENNQLGVTASIDAVFTSVNDTFCRMTGYTEEEIIGQRVDSIMHKEDYDAKAQHTIDIDQGKTESVTIEHRFIRKDGSIGYALVHLQRFYREGKPIETMAALTDISQLKATEQALRKSEAIYKKLVDNAFDGIEIHESTPPQKEGDKWQHELLVRNNKIYEILGKTQHTVKQNSGLKDVLEISPEYQPNGIKSEQYIENLRKKIAIDNTINFEWRYGNNTQHVDTEMTVIRFNIDKKIYVTTIYKDITEKKKVEYDLKKSEAFYKSIFNAAYDGIEIYEIKNNQLIPVDRNEQYKQLVGRTDEELDALSGVDISPKFQVDGKPSKQLLAEQIAKLKKNSKTQYEWRILHKEGHPIDVQVTAVRLKIDGKLMVTSIYRDLTESQKQELALRKSETLYRHLFDNAFDGIEIYEYPSSGDKAGKLLDRNDKVRKLLGRTDEQLDIEGNARMLQFSPEMQSNGMSSTEYLLQIQQEFKVSKQVNFDWRFTHLEGHIVDVNISTHLFKLSNQTIFIGIFKNITEKKKAEQTIINSLKKLNQKNQELEKFIESNMQLENFAYLASHDLKEPIRTIVSFSQLLEKSAKDKLSKNEKDYIRFIITSCKNMKRLIEDLLSYSLVDTDDRNLQIVNLEDILYVINNELDTLIKEKQASINTHNIPQTIVADKTQIRQLFQNLIANAIKYSAPEHPPIINITAQNRKNEWLFSIQDNGIGIKSEFYERIFLLFRKLHNTNQFEGTGIGLALCKKIVENHNGRIWVESEYGKGSTFYFSIKKI